MGRRIRVIGTAVVLAVFALPAAPAGATHATCAGDQLNFITGAVTDTITITGTGVDSFDISSPSFATISVTAIECLRIDATDPGATVTLSIEAADLPSMEFVEFLGAGGDETVDFAATADIGAGEWWMVAGSFTNLARAATTGQSRFEAQGGTISLTGGAPLTCAGSNVTLAGGPGADSWPAPGTPEIVHLLGGNDSFLGSAASETVCGGSGDDQLLGRDGDDVLLGGSGNDELRGKSGLDTLRGGSGHDLLLGGADADVLVGSGGTDILKGGSGDDELLGGAGVDILQGDGGFDTAKGGQGIDVCVSSEVLKSCEA